MPNAPASPASATMQPAAAPAQEDLRGLNDADVQQRVDAGYTNVTPLTLGDSYWTIIRRNGLSVINILLFAIVGGLVALEQYRDAGLTISLVAVNVVVGTVQEIRAKRQIERIALLNRPTVTVLRNGAQQEVQPDALVRDDLLVVHAGDQLPADTRLIAGGPLQVDESNLTGESDLIPKQHDTEVLSGSVCVAGQGICRVIRVGSESAMQQVTARARSYRNVKTPLQREVDLILRVMSAVVAVLALQVVTTFQDLYSRIPLLETTRASAVLVSLVPQGLVLMTVVGYALAVTRLTPRGILVQRINAIESLSHITTLCVDKTGTLTTQRLVLQAVVALDGRSDDDARRSAGELALSAATMNRTSEAIAAGCRTAKRAISVDVPFTSERKWSGVQFADGDAETLVIGAPEILLAAMPRAAAAIHTSVAEQARLGLRVLLLARSDHGALTDDAGDPLLPRDLVPIAMVSISDELRPGVQDTLAAFRNIGITVRVISGDNPDTVVALARQAGMPEPVTSISGRDIDGLSDAQLRDVVQSHIVFGRVTPDHKERLVRTMTDMGQWVAMTGDGVNDILAMKQAKVGIAMRSGADATQSVADMVLLNDSFAALPDAFAEGQRVMRGMTDNMKLFLTRTVAVALSIFFISLMNREFPITPSQNSVLAALTVGIPAFALSFWAKPGHMPRNLRRTVIEFVLPASIMVAVISVAVYDFFLTMTNDNIEWSQAAMTTTMVFTLLLTVLFAQPPTEEWVGASRLNGDMRPAYLVGAMYVLYFLIVLVPPAREFFGMRTLPWSGYVMLAFVVAGWAFCVRWLWRITIGRRLARLGTQAIERAGDALPPRWKTRVDTMWERRRSVAADAGDE